ncbi:YkvI family membrane protein [Gorillibacterium timonense]|uniref:YkvI family membrane protein n=1 Tax=Gorillibacterium timonense TaxID=1689269 RepID=UPI00071CDAF7|nr:hypothetical protein [Gorillibacterium timonense]
MRKFGQILQVAFTYVGTIVGAGFASGQEILQFFTQYGWPAALSITLAALLFVWLGTKLMLLAHDTGAKSYEDLNRTLLGPRFGQAFSLFQLAVLLGTSTVMIAGAGSLFQEQLGFHYQTGLLLTLFLGFWVLRKGMSGILSINTVVVPFMLLYVALIFIGTQQLPTAGNWLILPNDYPILKTAISPLLYAAFNLATAQAVLVPLGNAFSERRVLLIGGIVGGILVGLMLMAGHIALSARMPDIRQFEIPMAQLIGQFGPLVQFIYTLVIFGEIFTTFVADVFGLALQLKQHSRLPNAILILALLAVCYGGAQIGFSSLLSLLYPLFGALSLGWIWLLMRGRRFMA